MKKTFSLPKFIEYEHDELSYHQNVSKMIDHAFTLEFQVFAHDLLASFYLFPQINQFNISLAKIKTKQRTQSSFIFDDDNKFFYFVQTDVNTTLILDDKHKTDQAFQKMLDFYSTEIFQSSNNYIDNNNLKKIFIELFELAQHHHQPFTYNKSFDNLHSLTIDKNFAHNVCKKAYPEHYEQIAADLLSKELSNNVDEYSGKKRPKI